MNAYQHIFILWSCHKDYFSIPPIYWMSTYMFIWEIIKGKSFGMKNMWFQLLIRVKLLGYFLGSKFDVHMQLLFKVAFIHDTVICLVNLYDCSLRINDSINLNWISVGANSSAMEWTVVLYLKSYPLNFISTWIKSCTSEDFNCLVISLYPWVAFFID